MKLVFYSGGDNIQNEELDLEVFQLIENPDPLFSFIPSCYDESDELYEDFVHHFGAYGVRRFSLFPVDLPFDQLAARRLLGSDLIFLSGGNTFYFLYHLKKSGFMKLLKEFVWQGGVLAGLSAGSIIMSPNIETAEYPYFDCDENEVGITNLKSLGFVNFEFFPHFANTKRYIHALNEASLHMNHPLYAATDGSGILVNDEKISFLGEVYGFIRGKKFKLY